ncbi:MAG: T9SS type A sorting domain-containing protein [Bacteroidota bacterium]|nr:T9SS type A sorting domain-containing protein [Bacteroidota bacterium]
MRKTLLPIFMLTAFHGVSQTLLMPTLTESSVTYKISVLEDQIDFSVKGDWDFSDVSATSNATIEIAPIASSKEAINYPNATHVKYEDGEQFFLGFEKDKYTYHGEITILTSSYPEALIVHPYPFEVGNTHADSELEIPFTVPGGPPYLIRDDQAYSEVLSMGNVTMPDKTVHKDVLLVRTMRTFTDRQIGSSPCVTKLESHNWWAKGYPIPVVRTSIMTQSGQCPPSNPIKKTKFLVGDPLTTEVIGNSTLFSIYPNPVQEDLLLHVEKNLLGSSYKIYNNLGKLVASGIIDASNKKVNVESLPKGMYYFNFDGSQRMGIKFIKE